MEVQNKTQEPEKNQYFITRVLFQIWFASITHYGLALLDNILGVIDCLNFEIYKNGFERLVTTMCVFMGEKIHMGSWKHALIRS